jgi:hypothetical protein
MLIPVLFLCNAVAERRLGRHLVLAALAASGIMAWTALGALHGSGGTSYLDLMQGMAFRPATDFFERSFKEPFRGWYRESAGGLALFLAVVGVPLAAGLRAGAREFPRDAAALAGFFALCVATIVVFGINKARYVYPTEWIPLFFFAGGLVRLCDAGARRLAGAPAAVALGAALAAGAAWLFVARRWTIHLATTRGAQPWALDLAFAGFLVARASRGARAFRGRRARSPRSPCSHPSSPAESTRSARRCGRSTTGTGRRTSPGAGSARTWGRRSGPRR